MPTYENLMLRCCCLPSMCSICSMQTESSFHLFFQCPLAVRLWSWFASSIDMTLQFTSLDDIWKICDHSLFPQCKIVIKATLLNLINVIWFARNQIRFMDKRISWSTTISMLISNTSLWGNQTSKVSNNSKRDFLILKNYKVSIHNPKAPQIKEIMWYPPTNPWIKCNIDGASQRNLEPSSCGGVFRNGNADVLYCFAEPLGIKTSFQAELCGFMRAIKIAYQKNWNNIGLKLIQLWWLWLLVNQVRYLGP